MFFREIFNVVYDRFKAERQFVQVLFGPRQVGKTTLAKQLLDKLSYPYHYCSADAPSIKDRTWLAQQWEVARVKWVSEGAKSTMVLVLDEVQKVPDWSSVVKQLWDEDSFEKRDIKVLLLGSAALLLQKGLSESLAGRFELIQVPHWSFMEMQQAFGCTVDQYCFFGAYPGAYSLSDDFIRWQRYVLDSLIETTISRDILLMTRVDRPALLRQLFQLSCDYSSQILSYQKMIGQLDDAGNTTTLAHYLQLLADAGMVMGIQKFSKQKLRQRVSSPKLQVMNTALISAQGSLSIDEAKLDRNYWGRLVESTVGSYLISQVVGTQIELFYWRDRNQEVDFVLKHGSKICAIEVKSGMRKVALPGLSAFKRLCPEAKLFQVGAQGMPLEEFLKISIKDLFK